MFSSQFDFYYFMIMIMHMQLILRKITIINEYKFTPRSKNKNEQQTQPTMSPGPAMEASPHWLEESTLHTATLLFLFI